MDKIMLTGAGSNVTVIPNVFLDNYMAGANGEYVKVYLYLLRCLSSAPEKLTVGCLADALEHTESDIMRAIKYWAGQGLLRVSFKEEGGKRELRAIEICDLSRRGEDGAKADFPPDEPVYEAASIEDESLLKKRAGRVLSVEELSRLLEDEDVKMLLYVVQTYLGKTLTSSETNTILYIYSELGLSSELIEYLAEYCVSNNHKSIKYIERVALSWHEQGVETVEEAKNALAANNFYPVLKAFGISGRNPGVEERDFIVKWKDEYGFDMDIIVEACNRTIGRTHQASFSYADTVLKGWKEKGVRTKEDIKAADDEYEKNKELKRKKAVKKPTANKNNFNNFSQRTYDYDAIERMILQKK